MNAIQVDVAIIGAGTAGLNARRAVEEEGQTALLIDPGPLGTTCARVGCMPSKLLIAAAEAVHTTREGPVFGFDADVQVNGKAVMERVRRERDRFVGFVLEATNEHREHGRLLTGRGRLVDPRTVQVSDPSGNDIASVTARSFVVATGSTPRVPPAYQDLGDLLLDNEALFELTDIPKSVLVVGPGVIGLELGQALSRLGSRVRIVGRSGTVGPLKDPKMREHASFTFREELDLYPVVRDLEVRREGAHAWVRFRDEAGETHESTYERVLIAAGRSPNLRGLGLEQLGVSISNHGRLHYDPMTMQVGESNVFVAGDVNGDLPLLHEAADEGRIAGMNAARHPKVLVHRRRTPLAIVFTDPQMATVGAPWDALDCANHRVGEVSYRNQGRARVMNRHRGHVRIYGEVGTGRLLGAEMLGPDVEHTAHLLAWAIQSGLTVADALEMPFYHPVVEEGIRTALRDLRQNLRVARRSGVRCDDFGPGE
ncbi:MAG TPA: dihydrolipoyl dehydrogenase [Deltaproteobacteria bacterium]|nr:dihydrolipoyl dehydrogenase [Deltaproteobacteria bacterium]